MLFKMKFSVWNKPILIYLWKRFDLIYLRINKQRMYLCWKCLFNRAIQYTKNVLIGWTSHFWLFSVMHECKNKKWQRQVPMKNLISCAIALYEPHIHFRKQMCVRYEKNFPVDLSIWWWKELFGKKHSSSNFNEVLQIAIAFEPNFNRIKCLWMWYRWLIRIYDQ